jgi:NTP pyrophosphatase (non-canonical NTP hydrolase)
MNFTEYQKEAAALAFYPQRGKNYKYAVLGLCGEAGEIANKVKKFDRDNGGEYSLTDIASISKELGDVLWYCAAIASEFGLDLDYVATENIYKLTKRKENNTLKGSGDNR